MENGNLTYNFCNNIFNFLFNQNITQTQCFPQGGPVLIKDNEHSPLKRMWVDFGRISDFNHILVYCKWAIGSRRSGSSHAKSNCLLTKVNSGLKSEIALKRIQNQSFKYF